jgi:hypothetical protein
MADEASDTFGDGFWNFLTALGFISPLLGGEELVRHYVSPGPGLPLWVSLALIVVGLPLYQSKALYRALRGTTKPVDPPPLGYLSNEDSDLGSAINGMALRSAWGKWYAAQSLANIASSQVNEQLTMGVATHLALDALTGSLMCEDGAPAKWIMNLYLRRIGARPLST